MPNTSQQKPTSLKEMGFRIEPIHGKDARGNEWLFRVRGKEPVFYIKKTKNGKLLAFRSKDATVDSTISGLYDFQEKEGDLIGKRTATGNVGPRPVTNRTGNPKAA